jgi:hypothetical protein
MAGQDRQLSNARLGFTRSEVQLSRDPRRKAAASVGSANQFLWSGTRPQLAATKDPSQRSFDELVELAVPGADRDMLLDEPIATNSAEIVDHATL